MFWGLNLNANRKYSHTTKKNFHISNASLESGTHSKLYFKSADNNKYLICSLSSKDCKQYPLDLNFARGEEVAFEIVGDGNVTLMGYLIMEEFEGGEEEDEDYVPDKVFLKQLEKSTQKKVESSDGDEEEELTDDDSDIEVGLSEDEDEEKSAHVEEDDGEDITSDGAEEEASFSPRAKQRKIENEVKQNGVVKQPLATEMKSMKQNKKQKQKKQVQEPEKQEKQNNLGERTLTGGVKVQDIIIGKGPEAKNGKKVAVYYEGRLKSNNKIFDSMRKGPGFKFTIGRGEVIKGWDVALSGMKVGGVRRINCPPHMAYGSKGSPPTIPPNSTLIFEVELKNVN